MSKRKLVQLKISMRHVCVCVVYRVLGSFSRGDERHEDVEKLLDRYMKSRSSQVNPARGVA